MSHICCWYVLRLRLPAEGWPGRVDLQYDLCPKADYNLRRVRRLAYLMFATDVADEIILTIKTGKYSKKLKAFIEN